MPKNEKEIAQQLSQLLSNKFTGLVDQTQVS